MFKQKYLIGGRDYFELLDVSNVVGELNYEEGSKILKKIATDIRTTPAMFRSPFPLTTYRYKRKNEETDFVINAFENYNDKTGLVQLLLCEQPYHLSKMLNKLNGPTLVLTFSVKDENFEPTFNMAFVDEEQNIHDVGDGEEKYNIVTLSIPALYSIMLLNCKNIRLEEEPGAKMKRMLNKHKKDSRKKEVYKVLVIDAMKPKSRSDHESVETGIKRSFHVCRGHLRTYTEEKPLFGKYSGTYFIPAHVRGDKEIGEVEKDYKIVSNPPTEPLVKKQ